jgi:nicotinate-nucleotide pyrophosphorylase (carboxylating)
MTPIQLRQAVSMRDRAGSRIELEASGGVRLETVRAIAETGVDRISAGAITHSAAWLDVALDVHG